eukprot:XP_001691020.1 predicted protein [Chlamydomonas reinhardtii]
MQRPDAHEQPDANGVLYDGEPHLDVGDWAGGQPAPKFRRRGPGSGAGDAGPAGVGAPPPADSQPHPEPNIWEAAGLPRPTDQTVVDLARFPLELHVPSRENRRTQQLLHELMGWCLRRRDTATAAGLCAALWLLADAYPLRNPRRYLARYGRPRGSYATNRADLLLEALQLLVPLQLTAADIEASAAEVAAQLVEAGPARLLKATELLTARLSVRQLMPARALRTGLQAALEHEQWCVRAGVR